MFQLQHKTFAKTYTGTQWIVIMGESLHLCSFDLKETRQ